MSKTDFYSDGGATLIRVFGAGRGLPEYVLDGEYSVDPGDLTVKRASCFADRGTRAYPIHDPANTWVSYLYARTNGANDEVVGTIRKAASFFGINDDLDLIEQKIEAFSRPNKQAKVNWTVDVPCSSGTFKSAGAGKGSIGKACAELTSKQFESLHPMSDRRKIARELISVCPPDFRDEIPDRVMKTAGIGIPDMDDLVASIVARSLVIKEDVREPFIKAANQLTDLDSSDRTLGMLTETCDFLDTFDKAHNLTRFYGNRFPDPVSSVFTHSLKEAESLSSSVKVAGVTLRPAFATDDLLSDLSVVTGLEITRETAKTKLAALDPSIAEAVAGVIRLHEQQG